MTAIPKAYPDDANTERQPQVTQVRVAPTRLPRTVRARLAKWCVRGIEFCHKVDAPFLCQMLMGLEIALVDLAGAELRAENAENRARAAELELAKVRRTLAKLQSEHARAAAAEFEGEPTAAREVTAMISRCRTVS